MTYEIVITGILLFVLSTIRDIAVEARVRVFTMEHPMNNLVRKGFSNEKGKGKEKCLTLTKRWDPLSNNFTNDRLAVKGQGQSISQKRTLRTAALRFTWWVAAPERQKLHKAHRRNLCQRGVYPRGEGLRHGAAQASLSMSSWWTLLQRSNPWEGHANKCGYSIRGDQETILT